MAWDAVEDDWAETYGEESSTSWEALTTTPERAQKPKRDEPKERR